MCGVVELTKNTDNDEQGYRGYVFDFIHIQVFSLSVDAIGKNVVVICVDNSLSAHVDVSVFGKGSTDELDDHIIKKNIILILLKEERKLAWVCITKESAFLVCLWCKKSSLQIKRWNE